MEATKTKIMIFSCGKMPSNLNFHISGSSIEIVKEFNYLGVLLSRTGNFNQAKKNLADKATKAMFNVLKKGRLHNLSIKCQIDLFNKIVKPILLYGSEIWGYSNNDVLERIQLKFCKFLLKLKNSTPNYMIYGELGIFPLEIDIKMRILSFWCKLVASKETKLSSISYKLSYILFTENNCDVPFIRSVKRILDECGFSNVWDAQSFINESWLKNIVKLRLQDQYMQTWNTLVQESPKAVNYRIFKENFRFEKYFDYWIQMTVLFYVNSVQLTINFL